ncbi:MAG: hypothetical protein KJN73_01625 [Acidimicrobiia bacterium]|nr:hypothetical protein [Acidimicrobiia bacterium]
MASLRHDEKVKVEASVNNTKTSVDWNRRSTTTSTSTVSLSMIPSAWELASMPSATNAIGPVIGVVERRFAMSA